MIVVVLLLVKMICLMIILLRACQLVWILINANLSSSKLNIKKLNAKGLIQILVQLNQMIMIEHYIGDMIQQDKMVLFLFPQNALM